MRTVDLVPWKGHSFYLRALGVPGFAARQELNRLFNDETRRIDSLGLRGEAYTDTISPCINIAEGDTAIEITAELPGVEMEDINVSLCQNLLTIKGERRLESEGEQQGSYRNRPRNRLFYRTIPVIADRYNTDALTASFKDGVLSVWLPKRKDDQSIVKNIPVKQG